jgi:hypothetical protein
VDNNLLFLIRQARLHANSTGLQHRRLLIGQIFEQLAQIRDADLSGARVKSNRYLNRLIRSKTHTLAGLPRLTDIEFGRMLEEFESLLVALTDIIKIGDDADFMN